MRKTIFTFEAAWENIEDLPFALTEAQRRMIAAIQRTEGGFDNLNMLEPFLQGGFHPADVDVVLMFMCANPIIGGQLDTMDNYLSRSTEVRIAFACASTVHTPVEHQSEEVVHTPDGVPELLVPQTLKRKKLRR